MSDHRPFARSPIPAPRARRRTVRARHRPPSWLAVATAVQLLLLAANAWGLWCVYSHQQGEGPNTRAVAAWVREQVEREMQAACPCLEPAG